MSLASSTKWRRLASLAVMIPCTGCVIPFVIPPVRAEVGAATQVRREEPASLQVAVGTHLASGTLRKDQPFDVGAGYLFAHNADASSHGIYADGALFVERSRRTRTAVGGRGELLWTPMGKALGAKLRVDHELFGTGSRDFHGDGRCGVTSGTHIGTVAVGVFAEAGPQWLPAGELAWTAAAGVTLRLPTSVGVFVGIPGC
jgi:hypothetical protein